MLLRYEEPELLFPPLPPREGEVCCRLLPDDEVLLRTPNPLPPPFRYDEDEDADEPLPTRCAGEP